MEPLQPSLHPADLNDVLIDDIDRPPPAKRARTLLDAEQASLVRVSLHTRSRRTRAC